MNNKYYILAFAFSMLLSACSFLEPELDNTRDESILDETAYFCGPLNEVYNNLPTSFDLEMDALTDNAVVRNFSGEYYRCGTGAISIHRNPLDIYTKGYKCIRSLNYFLSRMVIDESTSYQTPIRFFTITSETDLENNLKMFYRLKAEAYGLRAFWQYELIKNFAGEGTSGQMLGVPLVGDRILENGEGTDIPRASLDECVRAIVEDCETALENGALPDNYTGTDVVFGNAFRNRISGAAVKSIKAKALLLAASPAYNKTNDPAKWEAAALAAAEAIKAVGGVNAALSTRDEYYFTQVNVSDWKNNDVIFKAKPLTGNNSFESSHYPERLYGSASLNVSQNLVDAFTDANGYPITADGATYDPANPYANRDPRLALFVGTHGGKVGNYVVNIAEGGYDFYTPQNRSPRTGYYLKKCLRDKQVSLDPNNSKTTVRANIIIGFPDMLLCYAEAANEAWGVTADPQGVGFTAKQALNVLLVRDGKNGNKYLNNVIGSNQEMFRDYVRLQRRIELCFEGHYFYDLRRWYSADQDWESKLNVPVYGIKLTDDGFEKVYLEDRRFQAPYMPIPYAEVVNAGLEQNNGWN